MKILVLNGPNLNLLGTREPYKYGTLTLKEIEEEVKKEFSDITFAFYQFNSEGEIIDRIQNSVKEGYSGIIINPAGYSHTSVAIKDALELVTIPKVEVHLSHLANREDYRQQLITAKSCNGYISGFKENGYKAAVYLINLLSRSTL